ncbi:MAG TPA: hypothetical protein DCP31_29635 [Cyanobacteria bacterium UBA8543]|nr:hypothetical protein [Cyanobacteria bacterium UBA8543]
MIVGRAEEPVLIMLQHLCFPDSRLPTPNSLFCQFLEILKLNLTKNSYNFRAIAYITQRLEAFSALPLG